MKLLRFLKLLFLGKTYLQSHQQIPTIPSKNVACYRGQSYNFPEPVNSCQFPGSELQMSVTIYRYRGVPYVKIHYYNFPEPVSSCQFPGSELQMSATIYRYRGVSYVKPHYFPKQNNRLIHH